MSHLSGVKSGMISEWPTRRGALCRALPRSGGEHSLGPFCGLLQTRGLRAAPPKHSLSSKHKTTPVVSTYSLEKCERSLMLYCIVPALPVWSRAPRKPGSRSAVAGQNTVSLCGSVASRARTVVARLPAKVQGAQVSARTPKPPRPRWVRVLYKVSCTSKRSMY